MLMVVTTIIIDSMALLGRSQRMLQLRKSAEAEAEANVGTGALEAAGGGGAGKEPRTRHREPHLAGTDMREMQEVTDPGPIKPSLPFG